jgi:hypothetical protein
MHDRFRHWLRTTLATLALVATGAHAAVRDAGDGIGVDRGQAAQRRGAETLHPAHVDRRRFEGMARGAGIDLPSTGDAPQHARFVRSERRGGDFTWIGKVDTELGEQAAVITIGQDATFGTIPQRHGPPLRVESKRGRTWLVEGEQRRRMGAGSHSDARIPAAGLTASSGGAPAAAATYDTTASGAPIIDVLVAYTPSMVTMYGSTSAVLTRLTYLESLTNQAYADTPANVRIRVVARQPLNYTAAVGNGTVLDLITNPSTNAVKAQIDAWRTQYGADLVSVVRAFNSSYMDDCGQGWIGGYHGGAFSASHGFSAVSDGEDGSYYCVDQTFAHELGHNMGSHHDIDTAGGDYGAYPYSRGYRQTLSATTGFATVMAYSDGPQTQLNRFSNPAVAGCMNRPCGESGSSDNARTLGATAATVAAFRSATSPPPAAPTLAVADASVSEGNSGTRLLTFTVRLSQASATTVNFSANTQGNTASAGSDFVSLPVTAFSIPAGQLTRTFTVTINGDTTVENNETFFVWLSAVSGATLQDGQGVGTITNDDAVGLRLGDASISEGNSGTKLLTFTARLTQASANTVTFKANTQGNTASAGSDFVSLPLTGFSIPAGQLTRSFTVTINGDTAVENNETFFVWLSSVAGAALQDGQGIGTITNDDVPGM